MCACICVGACAYLHMYNISLLTSKRDICIHHAAGEMYTLKFAGEEGGDQSTYLNLYAGVHS